MMKEILSLYTEILKRDDLSPIVPIAFSGVLFLSAIYFGFRMYNIYADRRSNTKHNELSLLEKLVSSGDAIMKSLSEISLKEELFYRSTGIRTNIEQIDIYLSFYKELGGTFSFSEMKVIKSYLKISDGKVIIFYKKLDLWVGRILFCIGIVLYVFSAISFVFAIIFYSFIDTEESTKLIALLVLSGFFFLILSVLLLVITQPILRAKHYQGLLKGKRDEGNSTDEEQKSNQKNNKSTNDSSDYVLSKSVCRCICDFFTKIKFNTEHLAWYKNDTKAIGIISIIVIIWFAFEERFLCFFEDFFIHKLFYQYEHKVIAFILLLCISLYYLVNVLPKVCVNYFVPYRYLMFPFVVIIFYFVYRSRGYYAVRYEYFGVSLLDVFFSAAAVYLLFLLTSNFTIKRELKFDKDNSFHRFYHDRPIENLNEDILGFGLTVKEFYMSIQNTLGYDIRSFSIGVTGIWGEGKSSFLYLLKECFDKERNKNIVMTFNPRHAKSKELIQLEFFQLLYDELKKYDIRFSTSFSNYLKAINVLDDKKFFDFLRQGHDALFDKEDEKEKINQALSRIGKKVVVFIEDLDRLLDDEIIEVCKLLDGNASFNHMLFITAYDKDYVNKILEKYNHGTGNFIDKFFTVEKSLPSTYKRAYYNYLRNELILFFEDENLGIILDGNEEIIIEVFKTLREVKRFLNLFIDEYDKKRDYVDFEDMFLLSILKFKWEIVYKDLQNLEVINVLDENNIIIE